MFVIAAHDSPQNCSACDHTNRATHDVRRNLGDPTVEVALEVFLVVKGIDDSNLDHSSHVLEHESVVGCL